MTIRVRGLACALVALGVAGSCSGCRTLGKQEVVSQSVTQGRQLTQQGVNAMERGDWKRAESLLEQAVVTSAKDADARSNYAQALLHRGAQQQALAQLEAARELVPADPGLAVRAGEVYLALGQSQRAWQLTDEATRLDPKFAPAWELRGRLASTQGQPREALAAYQRALGYAPQSEAIAMRLAEVYRQLNEPERALAALQAVAERYPPGEEPQQILHLEGLALSAMGRHDDAARTLALAAGRERPTADLLCHLAEAELAAGRAPYAQYALQQALSLDPNHAASRNLSARLATAARPVIR
jgi:tetratricopeptide (TPR) repeat protein